MFLLRLSFVALRVVSNDLKSSPSEGTGALLTGIFCFSFVLELPLDGVCTFEFFLISEELIFTGVLSFVFILDLFVAPFGDFEFVSFVESSVHMAEVFSFSLFVVVFVDGVPNLESPVFTEGCALLTGDFTFILCLDFFVEGVISILDFPLLFDLPFSEFEFDSL